MKKTHSDTESPEELLRQTREGDHQAFTRLVKLYGDTVYNFAFRVCRDKDKARETVQDTFINVFRKSDSFDGKSKFSTWLYSIVVNDCMMKRRKSKVEQIQVRLEDVRNFVFEFEPQGGHINAADTPLLNTELASAIEEALQKLPIDSRVVFILREIEQKSAKESAEILGITSAAVKSRLHRARTQLREELRHFKE